MNAMVKTILMGAGASVLGLVVYEKFIKNRI